MPSSVSSDTVELLAYDCAAVNLSSSTSSCYSSFSPLYPCLPSLPCSLLFLFSILPVNLFIFFLFLLLVVLLLLLFLLLLLWTQHTGWEGCNIVLRSAFIRTASCGLNFPSYLPRFPSLANQPASLFLVQLSFSLLSLYGFFPSMPVLSRAGGLGRSLGPFPPNFPCYLHFK